MRQRYLMPWSSHGYLSCVVSVLAVCLIAPTTSGAQKYRASVSGSRFKTIVTIVAGTSRVNIDRMLQVHADLRTAGVNAVRWKGKWKDVEAALSEICAPGAIDDPVEGVLVVAYGSLVLYDCETWSAAYEEIQRPPRHGEVPGEEVGNLLAYLKGGEAVR